MKSQKQITILLGHRGVGKTSLLRRLSRIFSGALFFCLDEEIEKRGETIASYFASHGEAAFRQLEKNVFNSLIEKIQRQTQPAYIAVGGGFQGPFPSEYKLLWVKRDWDVSQNIYFDRPPLGKSQDDLRMPMDVFERREQFFNSLGAQEITLPEGIYEQHPGEVAFFKGAPAGGCVTVTPDYFSGERLSQLLALQPNLMELRDDLLSEGQIQKALSMIPREKVLYAFRDPEKLELSRSQVSVCKVVDYPYEWGELPKDLHTKIVWRSLHSEADAFFDALEVIEGAEGFVKWSPMIKNFLHLRLGHEWMMRKPQQRVFLPRSEEGRWSWYRHLHKNQCALNFWREGFGSALDQPTLVQWYQPTSQRCFAAVLGTPVLQSWSPAHHADFWAQRNTSLYAIDVSEEELEEGGFAFLQSLGLKAAAVTSPLKGWAAKLTKHKHPLNTIVDVPLFGWQGWNTDVMGFEALWKKVPHHSGVVVWGGGGILPSLASAQASYYSARTGQPRDGAPLVEKPEVLIWASGYEKGEMLPKMWHPRCVVDLNYRLDSPARVWAHRWKAQYFAGDVHFFKQAAEQQKIWSEYEF